MVAYIATGHDGQAGSINVDLAGNAAFLGAEKLEAYSCAGHNVQCQGSLLFCDRNSYYTEM